LHSADALRFCARKFLDVRLTLAAEVHDFPAGEEGPVEIQRTCRDSDSFS
jgi:hypothetical protein